MGKKYLQIIYLIRIYYSECKTVITQIFFKNHTINERRWASLVAQIVMNLPAMQETWVQSLGRDDPLEKGMATTAIFLPGNSMNMGDWWATVHGGRKEGFLQTFLQRRYMAKKHMKKCSMSLSIREIKIKIKITF